MTAHLLKEDDVRGEDPDGFAKGCALIRSNLHVDPLSGDMEEWAVNYGQSVWLENWRLKRQADMLVRLFGEER